MKVIVGSARHNEYGGTEGGQAGDQTGHECEMQEFYVHELGWDLLRPIDKHKATLIADNMVAICNNDNIGYDWNRKPSLWAASEKYEYDAAKVTEKCNTNCAGAVRNCVAYAGISKADFYTGNEVSVLMKTGAFELVTDSTKTSDPAFMQVGDILVSKAQGHTVVVVGIEEGEITVNEWEVFCNTEYVTEFIVTAQMNLRVFGGTNMKILATIKKGETVKCDGIYALEVAKNKKWFHLNYNGISGFGSEVLLIRK